MNYLKNIFKQISFAQVLFCTFMIVCMYRYYSFVSGALFDSNITTDDANQQVFPFHKALIPELFEGDLITEYMLSYMPPIHNAMAFFITKLTHEPVLTAHWMMLIQIILLTLFVFLTVSSIAGNAPAFFSVAWLFYDIFYLEKMTAGLPRGWFAVVLSIFLYLFVNKKYNSILVLIFIGAFLSPPATLVVCASYGLYLFIQFYKKNARPIVVPRIIKFIITGILMASILFFVISKPEKIGKMESLESASTMPEFYRKGRFPLLPFRSISKEFKMFSYHPFMYRTPRDNYFVKRNIQWIVWTSFALILTTLALRKKFQERKEFLNLLRIFVVQ